MITCMVSEQAFYGSNQLQCLRLGKIMRELYRYFIFYTRLTYM